MTGNLDTFRQGASTLRNTRELTKEKREELIATANGKALSTEYSDLVSSTQSFMSLLSNKAIYLGSKTLADEFTLDLNTFTSSSHKTPVKV